MIRFFKINKRINNEAIFVIFLSYFQDFKYLFIDFIIDFAFQFLVVKGFLNFFIIFFFLKVRFFFKRKKKLIITEIWN